MVSREGTLDRMFCPELEKLLSQPRFLSVQELLFEIGDAEKYSQWWISHLTSRMPAIHRRNILQVKVHPRELALIIAIPKHENECEKYRYRSPL